MHHVGDPRATRTARAPTRSLQDVSPDAGPTYHVETWGCQMNVHDSEKLAGALEMHGYRAALGLRDADVVLLNTCSIREKAAEKIFGVLGHLKSLRERRPGLVIGVCGCVAQHEGEAIFDRAPYVDFVVGPRATASIPDLVARARRARSPETPDAPEHAIDLEYRDDSIRFPFDKIRRQGANPAKAFVTVIEGCNHRCTYCIVPRTRGREVCRPMPTVLDEVRALVDTGVSEIEFLGQTVNAYRDGEGRDLAELLIATSKIDGVRRIRFTTSHPAQMTDRLMDAMAEASPTVCPYLHLPVQAGSTRVLRAMRRGYDRERYLAKIAALRSRIPEIAFGTDVIVGFPAETPSDFEETLSLLDEVGYDTCYSFAYSPRTGTRAAEQPDPVPVGEKLERLARLQARQKAIQKERSRRYVGRVLEVQVEGPSKRDSEQWTGRSADGRVVNFAATSAPGRYEAVRIESASPFSLRGVPWAGRP